ncbi:hypothetical protein ACUV84_004469 [Puccinellia chinampoensis]
MRNLIRRHPTTSASSEACYSYTGSTSSMPVPPKPSPRRPPDVGVAQIRAPAPVHIAASASCPHADEAPAPPGSRGGGSEPPIAGEASVIRYVRFRVPDALAAAGQREIAEALFQFSNAPVVNLRPEDIAKPQADLLPSVLSRLLRRRL